jgi:hypothetical protein
MAVRRWSHFHSTVRSGLYVWTTGCTPAATISSNVALARSHCPPFSYALMRALCVMTSGCTPAATISSNVALARSHCLAFSQAVMTELYMMTSGRTPAFGMLAHSLTASLQRLRRANWEIYAL